jgi:hypothetical protein
MGEVITDIHRSKGEKTTGMGKARGAIHISKGEKQQ